jgi:hypothetical protein
LLNDPHDSVQKKETLYTKGILPFVWSVPGFNRIFCFV